MKKDHAFITRMVKCSSKLEKKYMTPTHKRKERLFRRKKRTHAIVPKEFACIFDHLAEPDEVKLVPEASRPEVRWNLSLSYLTPNPALFTPVPRTQISMRITSQILITADLPTNLVRGIPLAVYRDS